MKKAILGIIVISMLQGCGRTEVEVSKLAEENAKAAVPATQMDNKTESEVTSPTKLTTEPVKKSVAKTDTPASIETLAKPETLEKTETAMKTDANSKTVTSAKTEPPATAKTEASKTEAAVTPPAPKVNARSLMASTLATAKESNKRVFVHLSSET